LEIDDNVLKLAIADAVSTNRFNKISLPVKIISSPYDENQQKKTLQRAETMLAKKLTLVIGTNYYDIEKQELLSLLTFTNSFDKEKIASLSANLANAFDKDPENAAFNFENGKVTVFRPGKEGQKIELNTSLDIIFAKLIDLEATTSNELKAELPVVKTQPEISTSAVNDLGIKELLGKGVSDFRGSIASRIHNIIVASAKLNGVLVKPGEVFSFNNTVGDISLATGYEQAYIIQNGRTILGDGGGVCQVSTTLFRAALSAGLPIIERTAHAYRVAYYEQGGWGAVLMLRYFPRILILKLKMTRRRTS